MSRLRTPDAIRLAALVPIMFAVWGCWQAYPAKLSTRGDVAGFALFICAPALIVTLGTAITRFRTGNAPLPPPVFITLLILILGNLAWILGVFMAMG